MLLNIITRTSDRPNYFNQCRKSVLSQKGKVKHWVAVDNERSLKYAQEAGVENIKKVSTNLKGSCPWNIYFNQVIQDIDGWTLLLDDDDAITTPEASSKILKTLQNKKDIVFWRVGFPGGSLIPNNTYWKKKPIIGQISGIGFAFHSDWIKEFPFNSNCTGDYRLATYLWENGNIKFINETLTKVNREKAGGLGLKDDLKL